MEIRAELVANVLAVTVDVAARVHVGDQLLLLESMKMEIPVIADADGVVREIRVAAGDVVQDGDLLIVLDSPPSLAHY